MWYKWKCENCDETREVPGWNFKPSDTCNKCGGKWIRVTPISKERADVMDALTKLIKAKETLEYIKSMIDDRFSQSSDEETTNMENAIDIALKLIDKELRP